MTGGAVPPFSKSTRVVGIDPGQKSVIMGAVTTMGELSWLQNRLNSPVRSCRPETSQHMCPYISPQIGTKSC